MATQSISDTARERPHVTRRLGSGLNLSILIVGALVGLNFALAKYAVIHGVPPFAAFFWQILGATVLLLITLVVRGERLSLRADHVRYYVIGGLLGISGPHIIAYLVLAHIPAGLFTILITLSPLVTFALTSLVERKLLPLYRLVGILLGLAGISLATLSGANIADIDPIWLVLAFGAPILLAITNIYRNKAYPKGASPLPLAAGTLLSQVIVMWPVFILGGYETMPLAIATVTDGIILMLGSITAVSYILTYDLQRRTDGLGFSQVGYFATLTGIAVGAVMFDETVSIFLIGSVALLFLGLAITNGHLGRFARR